jgi:hypothetical protein
MNQITSTCKERNQWNETNLNLKIQQLSYHGASGCGTSPHIKVAALCKKQIGIDFISGPVRAQTHHFIEYILFAMALYGIVS